MRSGRCDDPFPGAEVNFAGILPPGTGPTPAGVKQRAPTPRRFHPPTRRSALAGRRSRKPPTRGPSRRSNRAMGAALLRTRMVRNMSDAAASGPERTREDRELFLRHQRDGDPLAREALVQRFMPLARQLARRYQRADEPLEDLVQVAALGLIKAIDRFSPDREVAFSSYAVPTILGELKRHFRDRTWAVRVPRDLQELALKVDRAVGELSRESHKQPSVPQIAERVGATEEEVLEALEASGAY